jgi:hypothetical protein
LFRERYNSLQSFKAIQELSGASHPTLSADDILKMRAARRNVNGFETPLGGDAWSGHP